jgi:uncharacterized protein (DUF2062 family)
LQKLTGFSLQRTGDGRNFAAIPAIISGSGDVKQFMFKPRHKPGRVKQLFWMIWPRSGFKRAFRYIWHRLRRIGASPHSIALGFATGVFMGFNPMLGFHLLLAAIICWLIGGSFVAAAIGTLVCNPLMCPLMMLGNYQVGMLLIGEHIRDDFVYRSPNLTFDYFVADPVQVANELWAILAPVFLPMMLGSLILGLSVAIPTYFAARALVDAHQRRRRHRLRAKAAFNRA